MYSRNLNIIFILIICFMISGCSIQEENPKTKQLYIATDVSDNNVVDDFDVVVYITETGRRYHKSDCRYLKKSKIEVSQKDAKLKGLYPCSVCKP